MRGRTAVIIALMLVSRDVLAQNSELPQPVGNASLIMANAAIGGLTAGLWRVAARQPFWPGFLRGAGAGTAVYAGKRVIGEGNAASWWIGRHLAALGSSEVVNAAYGRPFLQTAVLPIGPVRFHIDRKAKRKISPRLDLASSVSSVVISRRPGARFVWRESISTGAMVFLVRETSNEIGGSTAGVVTISELTPDGNFPPLEGKRVVLSHEMVHAAQYDFSFTAWGDALQSAIARRYGWTRRLSAFVDINLALPVQLGVNGIIDYEDRPWEREASSLAAYAR